MSVAISWANKMQLAKCDIMVGFPISSHIYGLVLYKAGGGLHRPTGLFGVAMSPRSASHRPRHDWRALRDVSPTQG